MVAVTVSTYIASPCLEIALDHAQGHHVGGAEAAHVQVVARVDPDLAVDTVIDTTKAIIGESIVTIIDAAAAAVAVAAAGGIVDSTGGGVIVAQAEVEAVKDVAVTLDVKGASHEAKALEEVEEEVEQVEVPGRLPGRLRELAAPLVEQSQTIRQP